MISFYVLFSFGFKVNITLKNSNYIFMELRRQGSVVTKSGECGGIQCTGWETLAFHVPGLEEGGWDGQRSRTLQGGGGNGENPVS